MRIVFEDAHGQMGGITADLEVDYADDWQADVTECVERVENEYSFKADPSHPGRPYSELVLKLPEVAPIFEIQHVDTPDRDPHP